MDSPSAEEGQTPLAGGRLLAQISTSIVAILREHYGRGPMKAKTYALDDIIVVVMRGSGFTALEQTIMDSGQPGRVVAMREEFQTVMAERYRDTIEQLTGRKVVAFLSQAHVDPDITVEMFFVDGALPGFGAVEVIEPELSVRTSAATSCARGGRHVAVSPNWPECERIMWRWARSIQRNRSRSVPACSSDSVIAPARTSSRQSV